LLLALLWWSIVDVRTAVAVDSNVDAMAVSAAAAVAVVG